MPVLTRLVAPDRLDAVRRPRDDVVVEAADGPDRFVATTGPFAAYSRTLETQPGADGVTERIDYRLAPLVWGPFPSLYRRALLRPSAPGHRPWWFPPETTDGHGATALGALTLLAVILGYLGSLLTQTITFAADEFDASKSNQSATLAAVRVGVIGALALAALADRRGRRRVLLWATTGACLLTIVCALAPGLVALGTLQAVVRGLATAASILLTIVAAEEMPAGSRAFGVSLLAVTGALGVGLVLFALPIADASGDGRRVLCVLPILLLLTAVAKDAHQGRPRAGSAITVALVGAMGVGFLLFAGPLSDTGERGWRVIYVLPLLFLPVLWRIGQTLPESRRFVVPHADAGMAGHGRRFWLLAASAFLLALFTAPASQLMNEFLRDERGFSAARISLFTILTNTPGGLGIVIGGRLADTRGRRIVGAVGTAGGVLLTVGMVLSHGWPMWGLSVLGAVMGAMVVPALGVYGPELFPTSLRGKANGIITIVGVSGSVLGLLVGGFLSDRWGGLGPALTVLAIGPLLMATLVLVAYPETAHRELEEINPEDQLTPPGPTPTLARPPVD